MNILGIIGLIGLAIALFFLDRWTARRNKRQDERIKLLSQNLEQAFVLKFKETAVSGGMSRYSSGSNFAFYSFELGGETFSISFSEDKFLENNRPVFPETLTLTGKELLNRSQSINF